VPTFMRRIAALAICHAVTCWPLPATTAVRCFVSTKVFRPHISVSKLKSLENDPLFTNLTGCAACSAAPHLAPQHLTHFSTQPSDPRHQQRAAPPRDQETVGALQRQFVAEPARMGSAFVSRETAKSHGERRRCALGIIRWV
jgi:hypothetical protein